MKDFQVSDNFKTILNTLISMENLNILLIGNSGSGKTTLINALLLEYYKDPSKINENNVLFINNLKDQGIQYYRTEVKTFCQTKSNEKKIIVLDDIDFINEQSQQVFRNCIDKYGAHVNFLCSCTNTQKVIESLQSRITCIKINPLVEENLMNILTKIIDNEKIIITEEAKKFIVKISNNSARILINYIEKLKLIEEDITKELCLKICTNICFSEFEVYTKLCLEKDLFAAIKVINNINKKGFSVMDILDNYFEYIKFIDFLSENLKYMVTKLIMKYISIFHNIHEDEIELSLFTNNLIILFSRYIDVSSDF